MNSDFVELLQALENFKVEYLVVGGYAVMAYAEPRFTKDFESATLKRSVSPYGLRFSEAWPNRQRISFGALEGWVISKSDLIINKRASRRPQDLLDAAALES